MQNKINHLPFLFLIGLLLACSDLANLSMGAFKIKLAYIGFFVYFILFSYFYGFKINRKNLYISIFVILSFFPSLIFSFKFTTSFAFFIGTIICVGIMLTFAKMTAGLGLKVIFLLVAFYRFSVLLSIIFVLLGFQERAHFLLYEPSYYAIVLIPYYCIVFYKLFHRGLGAAFTDIFIIVLAILFSQSFSMVLWCLLSFLIVYFTSGKVNLFYVFFVLIFIILSILFVARFHQRTSDILNSILSLGNEPSKYINLIVLIGGNRLQRIFIAYDAFLIHPTFGIGIGALKEYSTLNFKEDSFDFDGLSASDFSTEMNATNVFMEVMAEAGIVGLIGFLLLLIFVAKKKSNTRIFLALKISFFVTMISLLIESSYLRPYVWALYGIIIGLSSKSQEEKLS